MIKRKLALFIMVSLAFSVMLVAFFPEESSQFYILATVIFIIIYRLFEDKIW